MKNFSKNTLLTLLLVGFVSLFTVGCGGSSSGSGTGSGDDVLTGGGGGGGGTPTARAIFQFFRAQAQTTVPATTTQVDFAFFDNNVAGQGNQVFAAFNVPLPAGESPSILLEDIPATARSVRITVRNAAGSPISVITLNVALVAGDIITVDTSAGVVSEVVFEGLTASPEPLLLDLNEEGGTVQIVLTGSFSNVEPSPFSSASFNSAASFSSDNGAFNVSQGGVVSSLGSEPATATITASYTLNEITQTDTLTARTGLLDTAALSSSTTFGGSSEAFTTINLFDGSTQNPTNVVGEEGLSFALVGGGEGLSIDSSTGVVTAAVIASSDYTIIVTFDNGTQTYTGSINGTVSVNNG